jgi:hypothetical protein
MVSPVAAGEGGLTTSQCKTGGAMATAPSAVAISSQPRPMSTTVRELTPRWCSTPEAKAGRYLEYMLGNPNPTTPFTSQRTQTRPRWQE